MDTDEKIEGAVLVALIICMYVSALLGKTMLAIVFGYPFCLLAGYFLGKRGV